MKRDLDLIRSLLLFLENKEFTQGGFHGLSPWDDDLQAVDSDANRIAGHFSLLIGAGFIDAENHSSELAFREITWAGHDFLDAVRDDEIWAKTKAGALAAKGFTVDLLFDLAKGFIRKQVTARTGIEL